MGFWSRQPIAGFACGFALLSVGVLLDDVAAAQGSAPPPMSSARAYHHAITLDDGHVIVFGGQGDHPVDILATEIYDPTANSWSNGPATASNHGFGSIALKLRDGRVMVIGGYYQVRSAEVFDAAANAWSAAGELAFDRVGATAVELADGRVLVVGLGHPDGICCSELLARARTTEIWDPETNAWSFGPELDEPLWGPVPGAAVLADGRVLIVGGTNGDAGQPTASARYLDLVSGSVTPAPSPPIAGGDVTTFPLPDGRIAFATTEYGAGVLSVLVFDPTSGAWSASPSAPGTTTYGPPVLLQDVVSAALDPRGLGVLGDDLVGLLPRGPFVRRIFAAGGAFQNSSSAVVYDPSENEWVSVSLMPTPRYGQATAVLADGRVLVTGGRQDSQDGTDWLTSATIYDPRTDTWE